MAILVPKVLLSLKLWKEVYFSCNLRHQKLFYNIVAFYEEIVVIIIYAVSSTYFLF